MKVDLDLDTAVQRFASVADGELQRWFPDSYRNCIAAVRLATQVFEQLGFVARPASVVYQCYSQKRKSMYVSGATPEVMAAAKRKGCDTRHVGSDGWQGHLVCIIENRWWVDPTWQAALVELGIPERPGTLVFRMPEGTVAEEVKIEFEAALDIGENIRLTYTPAPSTEYESAPAWELDHLEIAIEITRRKVLGVITPDANPEHFVVYRRPRDMPQSLLVVRRWQLIDGQLAADRLPWLVLNGIDEGRALATIQQELRAAGRYRLERFVMDDPAIVEVWI